jgi:hypothetical protein
MLEPCRECGREVSSLAEACPHCGIAVDDRTPRRLRKPPNPADEERAYNAHVALQYAVFGFLCFPPLLLVALAKARRGSAASFIASFGVVIWFVGGLLWCVGFGHRA